MARSRAKLTCDVVYGREIAQRLLPGLVAAPASASERSVRALLGVPAHG